LSPLPRQVTNLRSSSRKVAILLSVLTKLGAIPDITFHPNLPSGTPVVPYRQTDRQTHTHTRVGATSNSDCAVCIDLGNGFRWDSGPSSDSSVLCGQSCALM
jgi:hypothetical protein